jgi:tetratricopeptide (TPR) repeat protein
MAVLGPQANLAYNQEYTSQKAAAEVQQLSGRDKFFALYDLGSSLVTLQDYAGAAQAYDQAYQLYPSIPEKQRPYRMTWYETGPYFAYYYTGRYTDVTNLATQTIGSTTSPGLEESFVWRARAQVATGDTTDAVNDLKTALVWHPGFQPALDELANLGVTP